MSRIDELIKRLCPDGVKFARVDELFDIRGGYTPSRSNAQYWSDGTIPWFRMEDIREYGRVLTQASQHVNESALKSSGLMPKGSIIIATSATIGEHAILGVSGLCNQRFTCLTKKPAFSERLDDKFLYYYCFALDEFCKKNLTQGSFASVSMPAFKSFKFPVPPMEIQEEIVRTLDSFSELETKLEAELEKRRTQYLHYLNKLLSYEQLNKIAGGEVPIQHFGDVGRFTRGSGIQKKDFVENGEPCIHYGQIYTHFGMTTETAISRINPVQYERAKKALPGDVIIAITSENYEDVCTPLVWEGESPVAISGHSCAFHTELIPRFVAYYMHGEKFISQKRKLAKGTKVIEVKPSDIAKALIPTPSKAVQRNVVEILDKFDALVNDLSSGIPAEIEARRKQYEYYRDKLLTFKEKPGD